VPVFDVEVSCNEYRLPGDALVDAVVTMTATAPADGGKLRIQVPENASVRTVRQVEPTVQDLIPLSPPRWGQAADLPVGAWDGGESRRYYLQLDVEPGQTEQEVQAARIQVLAGPQLLGEGRVVVRWADHMMRALWIDPLVSRYTGQEELARLLREATDALESGDQNGATILFSQALPLAERQGYTPRTRLLAGMAATYTAAETVPVRSYSRGSPRLREEPKPDPARFLLAQLPEQVPVAAEVSLVVRISADKTRFPGAAATRLRFPRSGPDGTRVTVVVQAPRELAPLLPLEQVIVVPETGDAAPARFAFLASGTGKQPLTVTAWAGGTFLGELGLELTVTDAGPIVEAPERVAPIAEIDAQPGEVTLQVRFDGQQYIFQLLSDLDLFEPVPAAALTAAPEAAVERTIATLRAMAIGTSGYTEGNARTWMEQAGMGLWNDLVPDQIKDQFWRLRGQIGAFSVAAGHDVIPWELLYPLAPGHDEGFLVEQFPVLRRVYGQQRARRFGWRSLVYVMPSGSPANSQEEVTAINRIISGDGQGWKEITGLAELLACIESRRGQPLHFASHNTFTADGSAIAMQGGPFVPTMLSKAVTLRVLAAGRPLIFMNACRTAGEVPQYTRMMGWARQFMAAGAGAFTGSLWAVRSESAKVFAEAFYDQLRQGNPLGQASQRARAAAREDHDDPTWLAYSVYGDPAATGI
jgi:hypothetical protein